MKINFDKRMFNPNFHHCMEYMKDTSLRYLFFYGGSSSGKTYSVVQACLVSTLMDAQNTIVFRKVGGSISKSIKKDFNKCVSSFKLHDLFDVQEFRIKCKNGAIIDFSGLDDPEKIKGLSSYKRIVVDEITELDPEDWNQLRKRMRGIENQKLIATFNPISEEHWVKTNIYDTLDLKDMPESLDGTLLTRVDEVQRADNYIFVKSTYKNNFWVVGSPDGTYGFNDVHTIGDFEKDKEYDINYYNIYALGQWGKLSTGTEFYKQFKRDIHVGETYFDPELPLHISVDENVRPFFPMVVIQTKDNQIKVIDEIIGKSPHNNVLSVLKMFEHKYHKCKNQKIYVYGDATSRRHDARTEQGYNLFGIIRDELTKLGFTNVEIRVPNANPSVSRSGDFVNRVLFGSFDKKLIIDEHCKNTIEDFTYLKEDADGGILKERARDKSNNTSYEKYGHCSDAVRYFICTYMKDSFDKFLGKTSFTEFYEIEMVDAGDRFLF